MKRLLLTTAIALLSATATINAQQLGDDITWDAVSLMANGRRIVPIMGEVHYSRIPADEWHREIRKMRDGGVTILSTYIFWNHHEEVEGVFDWTGQRDLRRFLTICRDEGMPVILRFGPYCHGEARCGGIPDWVIAKGCKLRDTNDQFMGYVRALYGQIARQISGLQWGDGGPVMGAQFDNEYRGHGRYLMALKQVALDAGVDLPLYTRTGWPELASPVPYGEMLPLYGDYADGFWDRSTAPTVGDYYKAFNFRRFRTSTAIATDQLGRQTVNEGDDQPIYPYLTCELGSGMATAYHRRPYIYPEDSYSMALVKLGSGSNLPGYYMYHGGTNPRGRLTTLNENQRTPATNHNDITVLSYDFQAPLGECGEPNEQYYMLRRLHLFAHDYGDVLAPMQAVFPMPQDIARGSDEALRWSYRRSADGRSAFVFVNNYERLQDLGDKHDVRFDVCGVKFPSRPIDIPAGTMCIFPVNIDGIKYATAQLIARRDGRIYLQQIPGVPTEICVGRKVLRDIRPGGVDRPVYGNIYLVDEHTAGRLFLDHEVTLGQPVDANVVKVSDCRPTRDIVMGERKVAEAPGDDDFAGAAVYRIDIPAHHADRVLEVVYHGDCARLYNGNEMVMDNYNNGRPMRLALWRLPEGCRRLTLRVLPIQPDMPVYLPAEVDTTPGEGVIAARVLTIDNSGYDRPADNGHSGSIDLSGMWRFNMGPEHQYNDSIYLPGSMLTNGKGNDITLLTPWTGTLYDSSYYHNPYMAKFREPGNIKFPFFLTPDKHYVGTASYSRSVDVPADWDGRRVVLSLERPHIHTSVYVNGRYVGCDSSLSVPHRYDVTPYLAPGTSNDITIDIYNGIERVCVGADSHSVTDQTQGNWNGIAGDIRLVSGPRRYIDRLTITPVDTATIRVRGSVVGADSGNVYLRCSGPRGMERALDTIEFVDGAFDALVPLGEGVELWDEFNPALYTLNARLDSGDERDTTFGMRWIGIDGRQFTINGRPLWIRGTVDSCCYPLTGYAPTSVDEWTQILQKCKDYGLNMVRFHSYCPPEAAFVAADRLGMYLQPEGPSWPNHGVKLGVGMDIDHYLAQESERLLAEYGNHPSLCMFAAGNEPAGRWVDWCRDLIGQLRRSVDNGQVYCSASVGGGWEWDYGSEYHVKGGARGLDWDRHAPQSTDDYYANITRFTPRGRNPVAVDINEPFVSHEQGQWCAFPDLSEGAQYTGAYHAGNLDIFADLLERNHMGHLAHDFMMASGRLQTLAYKYEVERNLRTPEYAGFQLLGLNDYSGQGSAMVGVLNVFWREKGYCDATDWGRFCAPVVPLARFDRFVYTDRDTLCVPVEVYNATASDLTGVSARYTITCDGDTVAARDIRVDGAVIPLGKNHPLCTVTEDIRAYRSPSKYTLTVAMDRDGAPLAANSWEFWVYPSDTSMPRTDIHVTDTLDAKAIKVLQRGGKVLLTAAGRVAYGSDVKQTYLPVFWNTSWFKMRPPHTTGALIHTDHPLFAHFPTDDWGNLNWWELLNKAQVMNLSLLPPEYQSPVQPIDTWHISRKLGMVVEANVLNGKLLMTTMDITDNLDRRPVARHMRRAVLRYMDSDEFVPPITLTPEAVNEFYTRQAPPVDMFTNDTPDELKPKFQ